MRCTQRLEVSALRRNLFSVLTDLGSAGAVEIVRRGHVVAVLMPPPKARLSKKPQIDRRRLVRLCKRNHIRQLALFGSILRDDFGPDSDVDVLVVPEPGHLISLKELGQARSDLVKLFGRPVDLLNRSVLEQSTNPIRKRAILDTAKVIYEAR